MCPEILLLFNLFFWNMRYGLNLQKGVWRRQQLENAYYGACRGVCKEFGSNSIVGRKIP